MFEKPFLENFARKLQKSEYNKSQKADPLIPNYIDGIVNCLNGYITRYASSPNENTFQQLAEGNGALCAELDDKSKKNKIWTSFFAIGVLANHRQQQIPEESPETEHLKLIIDGLQQIWGEGFILMGLPPKLNQVAVNNVLAGMEKWVEALELDTPSPEIYSKEVIAMSMLVNVFETSLQENRTQVESYLPSAFATLANIKKLLILKNPELSMSRIKKDNGLLKAFLSEQPVIAQTIFSKSKSLVHDLAFIKPVPDFFRAFLETSPEFAFGLLERNQPAELNDIIVPILLRKAPHHIGTLITVVPDLVNKILKSDRALVHFILDWRDSVAGQQLDSRDSNAIDVFMAPFKIKSTADILFSLQAKKAAPTLMEALDSAEQSYKRSIKYLELVARKERLNAFRIDKFEGITRSFDVSEFWEQYPNRAAIEQLCDDLGLASNSPQRAHLLSHVNVSLKNVGLSWDGGRTLISAGLSYLNTTFNPELTGGAPSLEFIITSQTIQSAKINAERTVETILSGYSILDTQLANVKEKINALDSSLKEITVEDWILSHSNFTELVSDNSKMWRAAIDMEVLQDGLDKYKRELDTLVLLVKSIDRLGELGVDVHDLSKSLEQYIEALYQQGQKQIYGIQPKDFSAKDPLSQIKLMTDKIDDEKMKIKESMRKLEGLWYKQMSTDEELIDNVQNFISGTKGWWHKFLKWVSPTYDQLFTALSEQIKGYHNDLTNRQVNDHVFAEELRRTLRSQHNYFIPIKADTKPDHVETDDVDSSSAVRNTNF
jgi:hypothetical protein